jgi:hypothetical protein
MRVTMTVANAPATNTPFDAGGPVAQAVLDSLGTRDAFASSPYPGELVVLGPGLAAGFWGQTPFAGVTPPPSIPPYPWFVSASAQEPEAKSSQGISTLEATSAVDRAHGRAVSGTASDQGSVGSAIADSEVKKAGSDVVATGTGDVQFFAAGPLKLGGVKSKAMVVRKADGALTRESSLNVTGATVADVAVEITPQGIKTPGGGIPTGSDQFTQILKQAGITVTYVNKEDTADGVVGAGLRITQTFDAPRFGVGGITYTIGQASASIGGALDGSPSLPVDSGGSIGDGSGGESSGTGGTDGATSGGSSATGTGSGAGTTGSSGLSGGSFGTGANATGSFGGTAGSTGTGGGAGIGSSLPATGSTGVSGSGTVAPGSGALSAAPASLPGARSFGVKGSYLVGVVAALVLAALAQLTSILGVRGRWT